MILLDALYINNSGGLELLKYLINQLEQTDYEILYLLDARCEHTFSNLTDSKKIIQKASIYHRLIFYIKNRKTFSKVLCFGNIPPPIQIESVVYTYFHNINLLKTPASSTFKTKLFSFLKRMYIFSMKRNTDYWIVQTENTHETICKVFFEGKERVLIVPFYEINPAEIKNSLRRNDYVYVCNYIKEKNHAFLIEAWNGLYDLGYSFVLHLTLSDFPNELQLLIDDSVKKGVKIINHGRLSRKETGEIYSLSKATIYPSLNESLGLGIIEALSMGCDVIAPNLPYIHSVCKPSITFNLSDVQSLVDAVIQYESEQCNSSELIIENKIEELLSILTC
jgi:glycosyltransferase involved in cell wall biosynthesis